MFRKVLLANRGEIALRVIRTCREMDVRTVAVYTPADAQALHVRAADEAYPLTSPQGYLAAEEMVELARQCGAEAIHPGYGFLSESADFARLCEELGVAFIGPGSGVLALAGDKVQSRQVAREAGVLTVPGYEEAMCSAEEALAAATSLGFPLLVKATRGGGGRGMRVVRSEPDLRNALVLAATEARGAFGSAGVYLEKFLERPRHIEIQLLADQYGDVVWLGERECSIQRRHQKLIEEAPSPAVSPSLRAEMGEAAVRIARAMQFTGVGTVEFLLDGSGRFYFLELNGRLQVEHGVTELVTGIDLVREQLRVAAGQPLGYAQSDVRIKGWAIECRLNAEDAGKGFLPSPGVITTYLPPGGPGVRLDCAAYQGYEVSPAYDSMFGKLMVWGNNRGEAIKRMQRALAEFVIDGIAHTIPFHRWVMQNRSFQRGIFDTSFVERCWLAEEQGDRTA